MAEAKGSYVGVTPVYFKDEKARAMLSNEYVPAENYAAGNLCIHEGKLYKATKATTGTWDATAWTETNLAEVNAGMQKSITDLTEKSKYINVIDVGTVTSFDNIKTPGVYTGKYTGEKYGSIDNFYMLVLTSKGKYINQYITGMFSYSSANIYLRYYDNSKWTNIGKITFS